ncbi:ARM repeat superfamily protein [Melia azedarach]|uniref:ARM repeat superfamily protein n=2 Tax=Melia azedarach TaxID=155640 RepID=A0ACC1Y9P3_MELAZ|nr:ARM repeat superfamily protein [Melia azedarach]KAJ4720166.1 ARM repeat superfamily protein [Melia azedarach]
MRTLASQLATYLYRRRPGNVQSRNFASYNGKDELSIEEEAERKIGWLLKLFFAGTATFIGYQFFPYMGDNLLQQSVSLLKVKDPLYKRMGASRLARFAIDDERRMKIVEIGGAQELINMLEAAKDDRTRKEALKALAALSHSVEAAGALHHAGAISVIKSTPDSFDDAELQKYKSSLLNRFRDLTYDIPS